MNKHTYDSGVIGNCAYIAHVQKDTNINWMCWPRFDDSFIFGGLLDEEKGGRFSLLPPTDDFESVQYYIENTNVLCTEITYSDGTYRVTDFAPRFFQYERYYKPLMLVRKIERLSGNPQVRATCKPVAVYGQKRLQRIQGSNHLKFFGLEDELRLNTNISFSYLLEYEPFVLNETKYLVLTYGAPLEAPLESTAESFLNKTIKYWRTWVKRTSIGNFHQAQVIRSALVLKIHQYEDTGAIIASSTTSLPESPGSGRNWDYRYCWLRDTFYTLNAFNNIGHFEELDKYFHYIANITLKSPHRFQPLYSVSGQTNLVEKNLDLKGYLGNNQPVRVGNQAYEHIQNDVYGQVLVSLLPLYADKRFILGERTESKKMIFQILASIERTMNEKDAGLWEFRELNQFHCYTFLFHWAGTCAAMKVAQELGDQEMAQKALALREQAAEKLEGCFDRDRGVYTQAIGTPNLDASSLQLILMNYLDPAGDKASRHLVVLESELKSSNGLFYRYKHQDDFGTPETTFLICAFWYVETLAAVGRVDDAIEKFESLLKYSNHLGLFSEDVDAETGSQWGNFPQTYSHVGLVNAAYRIAKKLDRPNFL
ncbi:MAG: glycoside hydrolase family 15 protein [Cyclobacteriaceae bacterium]|nr:glycoside hydrolase family 15 protein [Cyclobacteriaceae bacterium]